MKMPWTKQIEILSSKMQKTFDIFSSVIIEGDAKAYDKAREQLNIVNKSHQIKHNRLDARLLELEACFKGELAHYRKRLEMLEIAAATDAEKAVL